MRHVPHTWRHLKFLIVGRNLKQASRLRAFFDILQLAAVLGVLPLYWKMQFRIDPEISALPLSPVASYFTVLRPFTVSLPILRQVEFGWLLLSCANLRMRRPRFHVEHSFHVLAPGPWPWGNSMYILRSGIKISVVCVEKFTIAAPPRPFG